MGPGFRREEKKTGVLAARWCEFSTMRLAPLWFVLFTLVLSGCGFEPLYVQQKRVVMEPELASIKVLPIKEHIGQLLEWSLKNALNPDGRAVTPRYALHVNLILRQDFLAIDPEAVSTRGSVTGIAKVTLTSLDGRTTYYKGDVQSVADYNIIPDAYASQVGQSSAQKRIVEDISTEIQTRLALYIRQRTAEK